MSEINPLDLRRVAQTYCDLQVPGLLFSPRPLTHPTAAPVSARSDSFGKMLGDETFLLTEKAGVYILPAGTTNGGIVFLPPELRSDDISDDFAPHGRNISTTYIGVAGSASFYAGTPYLPTGGIKTGYSWVQDSSGNLLFYSHDSVSVKTLAVRLTNPGQNIAFRSGTNFWGTFDHAITADRTWTFPDATGTVLLTATASGLFTPKTIPFADASGLLTEDDSVLTYDSATKILSVGKASTNTGTFQLFNAASAFATQVKSAAVAGLVTFTLPISAGTNHQQIETDGAGVLAFVNSVRSLGASRSIEEGTVSFTAGVSTIAVSFTGAFSTAPRVIVSVDRTGALQSATSDTITTTGFNFNRSSAAGTATGHWVAIGDKA